MQNRSQSHPRQVPGYLTVPQLAQALAIKPHWVYHQIKRGAVAITRDGATGLYLFPDTPETLEGFRQLRAGHLSQLRYDTPPHGRVQASASSGGLSACVAPPCEPGPDARGGA